jgi:hypothetical protein
VAEAACGGSAEGSWLRAQPSPSSSLLLLVDPSAVMAIRRGGGAPAIEGVEVGGGSVPCMAGSGPSLP